MAGTAEHAGTSLLLRCIVVVVDVLLSLYYRLVSKNEAPHIYEDCAVQVRQRSPVQRTSWYLVVFVRVFWSQGTSLQRKHRLLRGEGARAP
jgi:hypothetical protein